MAYIIRAENITKKFNETLALNHVNFNLKKGEIHGLVGANGSGKSTLMNILFGTKHIRETGGYEGKIYIDDKEVAIKNTNDAMSRGIGMVHQELALLSELDISSNIKINRENILFNNRFLGEYAIVDKKSNDSDATLALSRVGIDIDIQTKVRDISTNLKQFIEIAREIDKNEIKVLILDEPTSSLNIEETNQLLKQLRKLADDGMAIIFISHRLEEISSICDRVTILRDGEVVITKNSSNLTIKEMALNMIGQDVIQTQKTSNKTSNNTILSFNNVEVRNGGKSYNNLTLDIKEGEILGITGLAGHGQELFGYGLMGLYQMKGEVVYKNKNIPSGYPEKFINKGLYLLPDDRKEMSLMLNKSIWENMVFETYDRQKIFIKYPTLGKLSPLNYNSITRYAENMVNKLNIKINNLNQKVSELSGGNQQKVCIGRAITMRPEILFVGEPTRGIDIYSKEVILDMLLKLNEEKNTTIVISSGEISELKRVCDRIVIMYENNVFEIFSDGFDSEEFSLAISGRRP